MELTLKLNQRKKEVKALIDYLSNLPYVEISVKSSDKPNAQLLKKPNKQTIKAIKEVESGKTTKTTLEDFRKQLYS